MREEGREERREERAERRDGRGERRGEKREERREERRDRREKRGATTCSASGFNAAGSRCQLAKRGVRLVDAMHVLE